MSRFICIAVLAILIAGCQTTNTRDRVSYSSGAFGVWVWKDFVGSGPISIDQKITKFYRDTYIDATFPGIFIVTADGEWGSIASCEDREIRCNLSKATLRTVISACSKKAKRLCYVFAVGHEVVWDGPVTFFGNFTPPEGKAVSPLLEEETGALKGISNTSLCIAAVDQGVWRTDSENLKYLREAMSRKLTLQKCRALLN